MAWRVEERYEAEELPRGLPTCIWRSVAAACPGRQRAGDADGAETTGGEARHRLRHHLLDSLRVVRQRQDHLRCTLDHHHWLAAPVRRNGSRLTLGAGRQLRRPLHNGLCALRDRVEGHEVECGEGLKSLRLSAVLDVGADAMVDGILLGAPSPRSQRGEEQELLGCAALLEHEDRRPHGELVHGQRACLVRAEHVHGRKLLDRSELADERLAHRELVRAHGHC
mmetsp:Transcript_22079/g.56320  ORF Transcript_22079/g.56320 Transcript_22079/m.56320 type:complete len:224 (+) Transcript_22079:1494-2165(+)